MVHDVVGLERGKRDKRSVGGHNIRFVKTVCVMLALMLLPGYAFARCEAIDFDAVSFERVGNGVWDMTVTGETPRINMRVELRPPYVSGRPYYYEVDIVGCYPGYIGLPIPGRYSETIRVSTDMARRGIKLNGISRSKRMRF